ncbi:MAG: hypothetical protein WBA45_10545 [Microthrixaceae bacterium]
MSLVAPIVGHVGASATPADRSAEQSSASESALDWLGSELADHGGSMPGFVPGSTDWGLTADAILAMLLGGRGADPSVGLALDLLGGEVDTYTTWAPSMPEVREAGPTAKALLALLTAGRTGSVAGVDLEIELRSLMATTGSSAGRFTDRTPDPSWDASNGFGQSLAVLALSLTDDGVPTRAVEFLAAQQCPGGGFPLTYTPGGCTSDDSADTDATAVTVQALLVVERTPQVLGALERGVTWLEEKQGPTGAFGGTGPTAGPNSNSTGLIAQTLRGAGRTVAADRGASWIIATAQISAAMAAGTPASDEGGAIGYNAAAVEAALGGGITEQVGDQWRRSTTQAVLALGLPTYGGPTKGPLPPSSPPSTSTSTSTPSAPTTSTPPTPTLPTTSVPATAPPTTSASSGHGSSPRGSIPNIDSSGRFEVLGSQSSSGADLKEGNRRVSRAEPSKAELNADRGGSNLPRTGGDAGRWLEVGVLLLVLGGAVLYARPKDQVHS